MTDEQSTSPPQSPSAAPVHHSRVMGDTGRKVSRAGRRMGRESRRIGPRRGVSSGTAALIICVVAVVGALAFGLAFIT